MFGKSTLLAVAASAVLGLAVLGSTDAFARPGGHGGGLGVHHGGHFGGGHVRGFRGGQVRVGHFRRHQHWRWHRHRHFVRWHRPIWYAAPVVYGVARPAVAGPCTCLTKEYTPEGAVLFTDRCTNEMAMNPPPVAPGPAAEVVPQPEITAR